MRSRRNLIKTTAVAALGVGVTGVRAAAAKAASLGTAQYDALGVGTPPSTAGIQVQGSLAGALVSIKQLASTGHALVAYLAATAGSSQAAINIISANPQFSAAEITGCETAHGTLKIAHEGYADGSDANAAAVSLDLQTPGGTGTRAQGIYITSSTDQFPYGDPIKVRYNRQDWFVVKGADGGGNAVVINGAVGHVPAAMVDIGQAGASPAIAIRGPDGTVALSVDASGNLVATMPSGAVRTIAAN